MIRIGILGYGNLGKGVESAVLQNPDMELTAVFTRRDPCRRTGAGCRRKGSFCGCLSGHAG